MVIRRILGFIMLLTGLMLLALSFAGAYFAGSVIGELNESLTNALSLASQGLDSARSTLNLAHDTINDVYGGLDTAVGATANASRTIAETRPLLDNTTVVITQEVPEAVEGIQAALPNMIQVAGVIDDTLTTLSSVGIDRDIPLPFGGSIPLSFDLGIDYDPETSFDDSLRGFEGSLTGLPESLRGLESDLRATNDNLALLSTDLQATSDNLTTINTRISEILPLLDQYGVLLNDLGATITQAQLGLGDRLEVVRIAAIALLVAVGLSQLAPIYLGWELLTGRRNTTNQPLYSTISQPAEAPVVQMPLPEQAEYKPQPEQQPPDREHNAQT